MKTSEILQRVRQNPDAEFAIKDSIDVGYGYTKVKKLIEIGGGRWAPQQATSLGQPTWHSAERIYGSKDFITIEQANEKLEEEKKAFKEEKAKNKEDKKRRKQITSHFKSFGIQCVFESCFGHFYINEKQLKNLESFFGIDSNKTLVLLEKDPILADLLEERGYHEAAQKLREQP